MLRLLWLAVAVAHGAVDIEDVDARVNDRNQAQLRVVHPIFGSIEAQDWLLVRKLTNPASARAKFRQIVAGRFIYPLHFACLHDAPVETIHALLGAFPEAASL